MDKTESLLLLIADLHSQLLEARRERDAFKALASQPPASPATEDPDDV